MEKFDVVVLGSINLDVMVTVNQFPKYGDTMIAKTIEILPGGKGANQAITVAKLGKKVAFLGAVGNDSAGKQMLDNFTSYGIDTQFIQIDKENGTGTFVPIVDENSENTMVGTLGANNTLSSEFVSKVFDSIESDILLLQMETSFDSVLTAMKKAKEKGMFVILDPAPAERFRPEALEYADLVTPNSQETEFITGIKVDDKVTAIEAAKKLERMGVRNSIIKMGSKGSLVYQAGEVEFIPSLKVKAQNTVGAGDTFAGALACSYSEQADIVKAVKFGNAAAGLKVSRIGGQNAIPTHDEVLQQL